MTNVKWLIDELLLERQYECGFPILSDAAKALGCDVHVTKYIPFSTGPDPKIPFEHNDCVVVHGSVQFCSQIQRSMNNWVPGPFFNKNVKSFAVFASHYGEWMLNDDFTIIPYGEFVRRGITESVFIKPNSGLKEFTGKIITPDNFAHETNSMKQIEIVDPESLCVIAEPKYIDSEFRYVIAEGKVITASEYRWDGKLDIRIDTLPQCDQLAEMVAKHPWQPDSVYVCDIAQTSRGPKIVELNAFSSSGLYACDTNAIAKAVTQAAWNEYTGNI